MLKDVLVAKSVKKYYESKPMSIRRFIRLFEKRTESKIAKDLRKILFRLYPDSYTTAYNFIDVYGLRGTGKTLLVQLITAYDLLRASCYQPFLNCRPTACVMSGLTPKKDAEMLQRFLKTFHEIKPMVVGVNESNYRNVAGMKPLVFINDGGSVSEQVTQEMKSRFAFSVIRDPLHLSHYLNTIDSYVNVNSHQNNLNDHAKMSVTENNVAVIDLGIRTIK